MFNKDIFINLLCNKRWVNGSIMLKVWHLQSQSNTCSLPKCSQTFALLLILTIWIMIFLTRIQELEIMFGEGDDFPKSSLSQVWPGLSLTFYEDFLKRIWNFFWDFWRFFGNLDSYTSGSISTVASFWAEM